MQLTNRRILCAEANDDVCRMLRAFLRPDGYQLESAATVAVAISLARSEGFDLYLLGDRFPDGTGLGLCRRIRKIKPQTPILFFSSMGAQADQEQGLEAGAQAYLIKPHDLDKLATTIRQLLGDRSMAVA